LQNIQGLICQPILGLLILHAEFFSTPVLPQPISEDPDDDKFFACALASGCNLIMSGDKHLLKVCGYQGVLVFTPRQFVDKYRDQQGEGLSSRVL
jgi:predicted nucleic acid-binding protein